MPRRRINPGLQRRILSATVFPMTGKERVRLAMEKKRPDRVPFFCQFALGHYMLNTPFEPYRIWFSPQVFTDALVMLARRYRADGILVNLPGRPPDWEEHIIKKEHTDGETLLYWDDGSYSRCPENDNVHHFSGVELPRFEDVDPEALYYIEPHSITGIRYPYSYDFETSPRPRGRDFFPPYVTDPVRLAVEKAGEELHISSEIFSPFTQFMELLGYSEGLMALMDDPEKAGKILERFAEGAAELALLQAEAGPEAVLVSSAFAGGGFISREQYRQFVLPHEAYITDTIHRETDCFVYVHTCGSIGDRVDLMVEAGYDGVDTLDPPPLGNTDIEEVKERLGDRIFLKGNIDPVGILKNGTPEETYAQARYLAEKVGGTGGYILSSACSVPPAAPPENIHQLYRAVTEAGRS